MVADSVLSMLQVERQRAALAAIDAEAEEESGINRELANVMCTRLDAARRATEKLLGVLQARPAYPSRAIPRTILRCPRPLTHVPISCGVDKHVDVPMPAMLATPLQQLAESSGVCQLSWTGAGLHGLPWVCKLQLSATTANSVILQLCYKACVVPQMSGLIGLPSNFTARGKFCGSSYEGPNASVVVGMRWGGGGIHTRAERSLQGAPGGRL